MRRLHRLPLYTAIWAIAPIIGSPSSLVVMPAVGLLAGLTAPTKRATAIEATASLILVALGWAIVTATTTANTLTGQLASSVALTAFHAPPALIVALTTHWLRTKHRPTTPDPA